MSGVLGRFGFGHQVDARSWSRRCRGLKQARLGGELGGHGSGAFGVDLAAGPGRIRSTCSARGRVGSRVVEVEDSLSEAASFVFGVQPVAVDPCPDAGAGDLEADPRSRGARRR